jgi:hypothetical protein
MRLMVLCFMFWLHNKNHLSFIDNLHLLFNPLHLIVFFFFPPFFPFFKRGWGVVDMSINSVNYVHGAKFKNRSNLLLISISKRISIFNISNMFCGP